jgi:hypothetical protein
MVVFAGLKMISKILLLVLIFIESSGNNKAVNGEAAGCLQITPILVKDVNRIAGTNYTLEDRFDRQKSIEMAQIYLTYYGKVYTKKTGNEPDNEVYARMWNGGPNGWKKESTRDFWLKVKAELEKQQAEDD